MSNIHHTVFFRLNHESGSKAEKNFFAELDKLREIPGVLNFQHVQEVSPKNEFTFGLMMEFESQDAYNNYDEHPMHTKFVKEIWVPEVAQFQEIDFVKT